MRSSVVRSSVVRFMLWSLVTLVALTLGTIVVAGKISREQALDDARAQAAGLADRLAGPLVDDRVRAGVPGAADRLNAVMGNRMQDGSILHIKLWDQDGRVIWSDEKDLVGQRFALPPDVTSLFGTRMATAELSDLSKMENAGERAEGQLLEVYAGTYDADHVPMVFEVYLLPDRIQAESAAIVRQFVPLLVGALGLFLLAMLPLAVSLGRRAERAQVDRSKMMRHALLASELERRRIAQDLHEGVVQDLAGLGYALPSARRELRADGNFAGAADTLDRATQVIQRDVGLLRTVMTDVYPPDLVGAGLLRAVDDLVTTTAVGVGLRNTVTVTPGLDLTPEAGRLAYRVIREGLRNVVKHARATRVAIEIGADSGRVVVRVVDDGARADPPPHPRADGHLGLRLLEDTLVDFGGSLTFRRNPTGDGSTLVAIFPAAPVPA